MSTQEKPKILVVDDQPINIKLLQRKLERQGMEILVAYNGQECLDRVAETRPDLILLDVMMPEMDGIETCQHLKSDPETETIPIIFITAKTSKEGKLEGLGAGAVDYITKPIDLDETLARVRTQLRLQEMFQENIELQERLGDARKAAAIGAITQGIAHNLNNLLGVVVGYLDLIKNSSGDADMVKRSIGLMDNSVNRMVDIVRQLSTIAHKERHQLTDFPVRQLIEASLARFREEQEIDAPINLQIHCDEGTTVPANAELFESVLGKLLLNAWECYPSETPLNERKITVEANINRESGTPLLEVNVIDAGPGIAPEIEQTLFEPFITTKTSVGRGMGLTTARHTARNMEGDVTLRKNEDRGVTVTLTQPV